MANGQLLEKAQFFHISKAFITIAEKPGSWNLEPKTMNS